MAEDNIIQFPSKNTPEPELPEKLTIEDTAPMFLNGGARGAFDQFLSAEEASELDILVFSCGHTDVFLTADGTVGCSECRIIVGGVAWVAEPD